MVLYKKKYTVTAIAQNANSWMLQVDSSHNTATIPLLLFEKDIEMFKRIMGRLSLEDTPFRHAVSVVAGAARVAMKDPL